MAKVSPPERIGLVLAECELFPVEQVAQRWGISTRTISRYRAAMATDPELADKVRLKKKQLLATWGQDASQTILIALAELNRRMPLAQGEEDARLIHAIAGALKTVGELKIAAGVLQGDG